MLPAKLSIKPYLSVIKIKVLAGEELKTLIKKKTNERILFLKRRHFFPGGVTLPRTLSHYIDDSESLLSVDLYSVVVLSISIDSFIFLILRISLGYFSISSFEF